MLRALLVWGATIAASLGGSACDARTNAPEQRAAISPGRSKAATRAETLKIRMTVGDAVLVASLTDSKAAREFAAQLPLTLTLEDYASTEKVAGLPRRLSTADAPAGHDPNMGDIAYYAPWGNLAIYYRDFPYSRGLIHLGKIEGKLDALARPGSLKVTFDRIPRR